MRPSNSAWFMALALAFGTAAAAQAASVSSRFSDFRITLLDVAPNDGIQPALRVLDGDSSAYTYGTESSLNGVDSGLTFLSDASATTLAGQQVVSSARLQGSEGSLVVNSAGGSVISTQMRFTLAPNTQATFSVWVQGLATFEDSRTSWVDSSTWLNTWTASPGSANRFQAAGVSASSFGNCTAEGCPSAGSLSFNEVLQLTVISGAAELTYSLSLGMTGYVSENFAAPVPEPQSWLLLLAGLVAIGLGSRKTRA